jgi:hypothetical protein
MAYKLSFLLSLFFVAQIMCYAGDLTAIQSIESLLDACALTVSEQIAIKGSITAEISLFVKEDAKAGIVQITPGKPAVGQVLEFELRRDYVPLIIRDSTMTVSVRRSAVIGYID